MDYLNSDFSEYEPAISIRYSARLSPHAHLSSMDIPVADSNVQVAQYGAEFDELDLASFNGSNLIDALSPDSYVDQVVEPTFMCTPLGDDETVVGENASSLAFLRSSYYIFTAFLVAPLTVAGVAGNLLCLLVLCGDCGLHWCCSRSHWTRGGGGGGAMGVLLRSLSAGNLAYLTYALLVPIATDLSCYLGFHASSYIRFTSMSFLYLHQLGNLCHMFVSYVVLLIALERHLAARRPLERRNFLTTNRVRNCVLVVFVGSVLFHVPKLFEGQQHNAQLPTLADQNNSSAKLFWAPSDDDGSLLAKANRIFNSNSIKSNKSKLWTPTGQLETPVIWGASSWTKSLALAVAYEVLYTCTTQVVPVLVALVCTLLLVHTLRRARLFESDRQKGPATATAGAQTAPAMNAAERLQAARAQAVCRRHGKSAAFFERGSFLALFTIVLFVLAETPFFVHNLLCLRITIARALGDRAATASPEWRSLLERFATACLYMQACSNLFVYCLLSSNFRRRLRALCCSSQCCDRIRSRHNTSNSFHVGFCGERGCGGGGGNCDSVALNGVVVSSSFAIGNHHSHSMHNMHGVHNIHNGHTLLSSLGSNSCLTPSRRYSAGQKGNPRIVIVQVEQQNCHSGRASPSVQRPNSVGHWCQHHPHIAL